MPSARTTPTAARPATPPEAARPPATTEGAPPPTPPDAVPTTVEELPVGFWDDDGPTAAAPEIADRRGADLVAAPPAHPRPAPAPPATPPATAQAATPTSSPPALASLQGLALVQAVFPGRVVKVERTATADDDAAPDEAAATGPLDAPDDDPDLGADADPTHP